MLLPACACSQSSCVATSTASAALRKAKQQTAQAPWHLTQHCRDARQLIAGLMVLSQKFVQQQR